LQQFPRFTQQGPDLPALGDRFPGEQAVPARVPVSPGVRRIPAHRRACGSGFCRAPPVSGTAGYFAWGRFSIFFGMPSRSSRAQDPHGEEALLQRRLEPSW